MNKNELPAAHAFIALTESTRVLANQPNARRFALTWIAAARMAVMGLLPDLKNLSDLNTLAGWQLVEAAGLPIDAVYGLFSGPESSANLSLRAKAVSIVEELQAELRDQPWDVLPSLAMSAKRLGRDYVHEGELIESAAELLIELAGAPDGWLWLPFDSSGTMTIRALRKGWKVKAVLMMETLISDLPLLLAIETGKSTHPDIETAVERNPFGHPSTRAQTLIANPPFGMTVRGTRLTQWESPNSTALEKLTRIETWSVHELIDRVNSKAIFFVSPGLLFTKGQEQRLREYLVQHGGERNELEAVITLPGGVLSSYANIASAVLVINKRLETENVRMVDLGVAKRNVAGVEEIVKKGKSLALGLEFDAERARIVTRQDLMNNECIFTPSRYIRQPVDAGPNATALEEFFDVVRPPAVEKACGVEACEMGIPDLGNWNHLENPPEKIAMIRAKGSYGHELKKGDVILSVKGTLGKCGIVGSIPGAKLVLSQSCVALRVRGESSRDGITPEYLLMYLRSKVGQAQLASLQVGAGMQHISVGTLLSSFRFPMPNEREHDEVKQAYGKLCTLEKVIADIQRQMSELAGKWWMA
jgi:type I restriction-modification system DNA methylase subunit